MCATAACSRSGAAAEVNPCATATEARMHLELILYNEAFVAAMRTAPHTDWQKRITQQKDPPHQK